jgi:hypothetical protein
VELAERVDQLPQAPGESVVAIDHNCVDLTPATSHQSLSKEGRRSLDPDTLSANSSTISPSTALAVLAEFSGLHFRIAC